MAESIPMLLFCPMCNTRHIDEGDFATKPHHTHACQNMKCGMVWRPAIVPTVGVCWLPGFNNAINKLDAWKDQQEKPAEEPLVSAGTLVVASDAQCDAITELVAERAAQVRQWGGAEHDDEHEPSDWVDFIRKQLKHDIQRPLGTIMGQGEKHALCVAFLAKHYGDRPTGGWSGGAALDAPFSTVTVRDHHALVAAFLIRYNGTSVGQALSAPLSTIDTRDRFGIVTVTIDGERYAIVDIGMRMPIARELYRAQGFPESYVIDATGPSGKPLSATAQKRMCGNAVSPPIAAAIVRAQFGEAA